MKTLLFFLIPFIFPVAVQARDITLSVQTSTRVSGSETAVEVTVANSGTEAALDVLLSAEFEGRCQKIWLDRKISPGGSRTADMYFDLPVRFSGVYPVFLTISYRDARGGAFSCAALGLVRIGRSPEAGLRITAEVQAEAGDKMLHVSLHDDPSAGYPVSLTCHVPAGMQPEPKVRQLIVEKGRAAASIRIKSEKAAPGRYGIFVLAEYERDGIHHLVYASQTIAAGEENADAPLRAAWLPFAAVLGVLGISAAIFSIAGRRGRVTRSPGRPQPGGLPRGFDAAMLLVIECFILSYLSPADLFTDTIATGGDTASHFYTLHVLRNEILSGVKISGWTMGNYAGFPLLQFYFPLPFLLMCGLGVFLPLQVAFKLVTVLGPLLLPVAAYLFLSLVRRPFPEPVFGALFTIPFLFNPENSMWGGNLLSTLAGEFSYSLSLSLAVVFLGTLYRGCRENRLVAANAGLVFLIGFSHGYTLLFTAAISIFFLITPRDGPRRLVYLFKVYGLGFLFLCFWLVPLLAYSPFTTPYHTAWTIDGWLSLFPRILLPFFVIAGAVSAAGLIARFFSPVRKEQERLSMLAFLWFGLLSAGFLYLWAPALGVVDIRYVPIGHLMLCFAAAVGAGGIGSGINRAGLRAAGVILAAAAVFAWTGPHVDHLPMWAEWNYRGFEAKAGWPEFQRIQRTLRGTFADPRVAFEHSSTHDRFGSIRAFESLPLFSGRATLEGLYMQAAVSAPFVFYIQSEISHEKSCPFTQYFCGQMDFNRARRHLSLFNVETLLLCSPRAKDAVRASPGYRLAKTIGEYELWDCKNSSGRYVVPLTHEPVFFHTDDWKTAAYQWFVRDDPIDVPLAFLPPPAPQHAELFKLHAYAREDIKPMAVDTTGCRIEETIRNHEILIRTNWIHRPLLVKVSYHPRWQVQGAGRVYLVSPCFMLIFPDKEDVRLTYGPGPADRIGLGLSLLGLFLLGLRAPLPLAGKPSGYKLLAQKISKGHFNRSRGSMDGITRTLNRIWIVAIVLGAIALAAATFRVYAGDPHRIFNRAVQLKDAGRFEEAAEKFRTVFSAAGPVSRLAYESGYYCGICRYLQSDCVSAVRIWEDLVERFPNGSLSPEIQYHTGLCHFTAGRIEAGAEKMRLLRLRYPGTQWAAMAEDRIAEHRH